MLIHQGFSPLREVIFGAGSFLAVEDKTRHGTVFCNVVVHYITTCGRRCKS